MSRLKAFHAESSKSHESSGFFYLVVLGGALWLQYHISDLLFPHLILQVFRLREGVGIATNNVAEYRGCILGLRYALTKGYKHICVRGDSKLVCMQVLAIPLQLSYLFHLIYINQ